MATTIQIKQTGQRISFVLPGPVAKSDGRSRHLLSNRVFFSIIMQGGAVAARVAHNHEVAGSTPAPAIMGLTGRDKRLPRLFRSISASVQAAMLFTCINSILPILTRKSRKI